MDEQHTAQGDEADLKSVEELAAVRQRILGEVRKTIVGQETVIEELLIAMLAGGHCLLVGVPGLAKTLMVRSLAETLSLSFNRIQFTPDLMPADITGTEVIQEDRTTGHREFRFIQGPVFANVLLADEINRTPPKTQAALLEAMQEHQVTTGGVRHMLPEPFFVLATRNPIEQEGTYPLPEAQLDRFMFEVLVDYPSEAEEFAIVRQTTAEAGAAIDTVLSRDDLVRLQAMVRRVPVADHVIRYAMQFSRLTRQPLGRRRNAPGHQVPVPDFIRDYVSWGAGPRASQYLILGARARAVLQGRTSAGIQDVKAVAGPVLRHRIITSFNAESEGITADDIIHRLAEMIPADPGELAGKDGFPDVFRAADAH